MQPRKQSRAKLIGRKDPPSGGFFRGVVYNLHMSIQWNHVTWYSKLLSVIVLLIILPIVFFRLGERYSLPVPVESGVVMQMPTTTTSEDVATSSDECAELLQQQPMNQCAYEVFQNLDVQMNTLYTQVTQKEQFLSDIGPKIKKSQEKWLAYRDSECEAEGHQYEGGSLQPFTISSCKSAITQARISELQNWLEMFSL
ncbi:MAG: hypothetical protein RJB39_41 [Candidatus Parcubacteria bacterium]